SVLNPHDTLPALERCLDEDQDGLFFFDLKFLADGPRAMTWNERAVKWRSDFLKIPFGDQGFLIRRQVFEDLGGYPEDLAYGEDHVFVWRVRQGGFSVEGVGAGLFTSARKYRKGGWLKVTVLHVWLTVKQAVPQWIKLQRLRIGRLIS
ncbi:MAG: glycosyl transferase family 2, partial [Pseudomonadota bacterium]